MAKGISDLYFRLGLNYDELNQDFVAVEETISANIQRLKVQQQSLTAQIEKQAQKAAIALKQQELALAKSSSKGGGLLDGYNNIKGDISGAIGRLSNAFQGLKDASGSADGAITKTLEIIDAIPSPVGKAVAALASIPLVVKGVENSLLNLAQPAISAGDSFYAMARG